MIDAFRAAMAQHIERIAARHWRELHKAMHFKARSEGQKRRHQRTRINYEGTKS